jgi:hypothetical protein
MGIQHHADLRRRAHQPHRVDTLFCPPISRLVLAERNSTVTCMQACLVRSLLFDLLNSVRIVDGIECDALAHAASAHRWMRERSIRPTYSEWMAMVEARTILHAVVRNEQPTAALKPFLSAVNCRAKEADSALAATFGEIMHSLIPCCCSAG